MSKVLVDRELLERCVDRWACCAIVETPGAEQAWLELRAVVKAAQPAEAEGVEVVGWRIGFPNGSGYKLYEQRQDWAYEGYGSISYEVQDLMTVAQHERTLSAVTAERDRLQSQLAETQANDRTAMGYLHDVRQLVGGSDFPEMVRNVARMVDALPGCVELIEALSPIEGDVLRKARAAMAAKEA